MAPSRQSLDMQQLEKAVVALKRFVGAQDSSGDSLFSSDDEFLYIMISLKKSHPMNRSDKPIRIPLPHPIYDFDGADICLFVKDDKSGEGHKTAKKRIQQYSSKAGIAKVIGTSKLRTKYESFEAKRNLCTQYDLFLADDRILPSLPKLIGKQFFKKKKQPIPIKLTVKDWEAQFRKARNCTALILSGGSCVTVKVARSSFSTEAVLANIQAVMTAAAQHIPKKWPNIQAVYLKTSDSVALPVYQSLPEATPGIS